LYHKSTYIKIKSSKQTNIKSDINPPINPPPIFFLRKEITKKLLHKNITRNNKRRDTQNNQTKYDIPNKITTNQTISVTKQETNTAQHKTNKPKILHPQRKKVRIKTNTLHETKTKEPSLYTHINALFWLLSMSLLYEYKYAYCTIP
jgi:hypothetical protein